MFPSAKKSKVNFVHAYVPGLLLEMRSCCGSMQMISGSYT